MPGTSSARWFGLSFHRPRSFSPLVSPGIARFELVVFPDPNGDHCKAFGNVNRIEALLLLAHSERCCGPSLHDENSAGTSHKIAGDLAGSMVIVTGEQHFDSAVLDRVKRQFLPSNRTSQFSSDLKCKEGVVSDEDSHRVARSSSKGFTDERYLILVDASVFEGQRASRVDPKDSNSREFNEWAQGVVDEASIASQWPQNAPE